MQNSNLHFLRYVIIFFFFIILLPLSRSQAGYLPGYIIQLNNDTLHGLIDYKNWPSNPEFISFKLTVSASQQTFTPQAISAFGVAGEKYISAEVDLISGSDDESTPEFALQKATVFLQSLIEGKLDLYYYNPKFGAEQFFLRDQNIITSLLYKQYKLTQDGKESTLANKRYINQLKMAMQDCPSIQSTIQETLYKRSSLDKLFIAYHDCAAQPLTHHKEKEKLKPKFMLSAGLSSTSVKFSGAYYLAEIDFETHNPRPAVGAGIQFILPKSQQRLSIPFELMVTSFKISGIYNDDLMPDTIDIGYTYLKWSLSLLYTLPVGKMKLFGGAGLANARSIHDINCRINNSVFQNLQKSKAISQEGSSERSVLFRLGLLVKNYSFDVRFENTNSFSQRDDFLVEEHRIYAMLGYRF